MEIGIGLFRIDARNDRRHLGDVVAHHGGEIGFVLDRDRNLAAEHYSWTTRSIRRSGTSHMIATAK